MKKKPHLYVKLKYQRAEVAKRLNLKKENKVRKIKKKARTKRKRKNTSSVKLAELI